MHEIRVFSGLSIGHCADQFALEDAQDRLEIVTAFEHLTIQADDAILPLFEAQFRVLFDTVERVFRGPAKDRKDSAILEAGNTVIAPFARRDHTAIEAENKRQLGAVEGDL